MVSLEVLIRGFCVGIAASITVGPVAVLCIQRTLSKNRKSGIVSGLGIAAADSIMAMIAYFCYSILQTHIEQYNQLLRVIAGIFVIIVGVYIFFQNPVPQIRRNRAGRTTLAGFRLDIRTDDRQFHPGHPLYPDLLRRLQNLDGRIGRYGRIVAWGSRYYRILRRCLPLVDIPCVPDQPLQAPFPPPTHAHNQPCSRSLDCRTGDLLYLIHFFQHHPSWNALNQKKSS